MGIDVYQCLYTKLNQILEQEPESCHDLIEILEIIRKLKYKPIVEYFSSYPKYAEQIALRLEKSMYPMEIISDTDCIVGDAFKGFAKSFVHVIRNGIDHGIETPEERACAGKDEVGTIVLSIHENNDLIEIEFSDDGSGINLLKLKERAVETGAKTASECDAMSDDEAYLLVFEDYLSTKDDVNDLSGRGIGLSSVRFEVEKLGGSCHVVSELGIGTRFLFILPKNTLNEGVYGV
jgi:two-component system chemotaxis sensor kinase CheA